MYSNCTTIVHQLRNNYNYCAIDAQLLYNYCTVVVQLLNKRPFHNGNNASLGGGTIFRLRNFSYKNPIKSCKNSTKRVPKCTKTILKPPELPPLPPGPPSYPLRTSGSHIWAMMCTSFLDFFYNFRQYLTTFRGHFRGFSTTF